MIKEKMKYEIDGLTYKVEFICGESTGFTTRFIILVTGATNGTNFLKGDGTDICQLGIHVQEDTFATSEEAVNALREYYDKHQNDIALTNFKVGGEVIDVNYRPSWSGHGSCYITVKSRGGLNGHSGTHYLRNDLSVMSGTGQELGWYADVEEANAKVKEYADSKKPANDTHNFEIVESTRKLTTRMGSHNIYFVKVTGNRIDKSLGNVYLRCGLSLGAWQDDPRKRACSWYTSSKIAQAHIDEFIANGCVCRSKQGSDKVPTSQFKEMAEVLADQNKTIAGLRKELAEKEKAIDNLAEDGAILSQRLRSVNAERNRRVSDLEEENDALEERVKFQKACFNLTLSKNKVQKLVDKFHNLAVAGEVSEALQECGIAHALDVTESSTRTSVVKSEAFRESFVKEGKKIVKTTITLS